MSIVLHCGSCNKHWGNFTSKICGPPNILCEHCGEFRTTWLKLWSDLSKSEQKKTIRLNLYDNLMQVIVAPLLWIIFPVIIFYGFVLQVLFVSDTEKLGPGILIGLIYGIGGPIYYYITKKNQVKHWKNVHMLFEKEYLKTADKKEDCVMGHTDCVVPDDALNITE